MAYKVKKGAASATPEKIGAYKGGATMTNMGKIAKKPTGTGFTAVGTNRKTGEKTVRSGIATPISKSQFNSGAVTSGVGKMMKKSTPRKTAAVKANRAKSILDKELLTK